MSGPLDDVDDISALIHEEEAKAESIEASSLSEDVDPSFVGKPTLPRADRWILLRKTKKLLWNTETSAAISLLTTHPNDPAVMLEHVEALMWAAALSESDEIRNTLNGVLNRVDAWTSAAQVRLMAYIAAKDDATVGNVGQSGLLSWFSAPVGLDRVPKEAVAVMDAMTVGERRNALVEIVLTLAWIPVARALMALRSGTKSGFVSGGYQLRKAWKAFEFAQAHLAAAHAHAPDPAIEELISFGVGAFELSVSFIPASFRWLIELIGFHGDRAAAKVLLAKARKSPVVGREATLLLAVMKGGFEGDMVRARRWLNRLRERNPESPLLWSLSGRLARHEGRVSDAFDFYAAALNVPHLNAPQLCSTINYNMGQLYFARNEFADAAKHLDAFLTTTKGVVFRPFAAFRLGVSLWHLERKDEIAPLYKRALEWVRPHESYDAYSQFRMQQFLDQGGFDAFQVILDQVEGLYEGHDDRRALKLLDTAAPVLKDLGKRDYFAQFYFQKGASLRRIGQDERAEKFLRSAIGELRKTETQPHFAVAYALTELGELLAERKDVEAATQAWSEAKALPATYHWHKMLHNRLKANEEKKHKMADKPGDDDDEGDGSEDEADWGEARD